MNSLRRYWFGLRGLSGFGLIFLAVSCSKQTREEYVRGDTMGTYYTVQYWGEGRSSIQDMDTEINTLLNQFETELSNWRVGSWINKFNETPANIPVAVPADAFEVIKLSLQLAEKSGGMLDPTAGPLIELWGFGTDRSQVVPSQEAIDQLRSQIGYQNLRLDPVSRTLEKTVPGIQLNCSSIAKGYAVDLVAELLNEEGIEHYLINIGGEVRAHGFGLDGQPWKVGIRQPVFQGRDGKTVRSIELHNQALATSGHSQRSFELDGIRYSHILNPKTGYPVPANIASVSVVASSCALADGFATLALILDETQMQKLINEYVGTKLIYTQWSIEDVTLKN